MKCKNKEVKVNGIEYFSMGDVQKAIQRKFTCIITNDEKGKTLSIDNGYMQFTIPFESLEAYFKGDYKK